MNDEERPAGFDPYRPLAQSLKSGDAINKWILWRPRQRIVQLLNGQRVLDVGCGTGNLASMLVEGGCQVVGVDSSPTMLSYARGRHIAAEFLLMDATQLPFDHEFDAAVISLALHEMPPPVREKVWEAMRHAVRPGRQLIALDYAVPSRSSLAARFTSGLIERDERGFANIHPAHYENFREFMRNGGLLSWIRKLGQPPEAEYRYWSGTVAVVVARP